jgi:hypothetical protein
MPATKSAVRTTELIDDLMAASAALLALAEFVQDTGPIPPRRAATALTMAARLAGQIERLELTLDAPDVPDNAPSPAPAVEAGP